MLQKALLFGLLLVILSSCNMSKEEWSADEVKNHLGLGESALNEKNFDKAVEHFEKGANLEENAPKPDRARLFQLYYGLGLTRFEQHGHNHLYLSLQAMNKAHELNDQDGKTMYYLGLIYQELGGESSDLHTNQKAVKFLERASKAIPDSWRILLQLGIAYNRVGKNKEGLAAIHKSNQLESKKPFIKMHLGAAYTLCKMYKEAEAEYLGILEINPEFSKVRFNLGWMYLHAEDEKFKSVEKAIEFGEEALVLEPTAPYNFQLLASAYEAKGEYQKAFELCEDAMKLKPDNAAMFHQMMIRLETKMMGKKKKEARQKPE